MDTKKFEYLETIREAIEMGDYEELNEYVEDIRDRVKADPDFRELFEEIKSKKYHDAISLIDEFIYQDIETEFGNGFDEPAIQHLNGNNGGKVRAELTGIDADMPDEITFEEFHEEDFADSPGYEDE
jgi:hypothetical protein